MDVIDGGNPTSPQSQYQHRFLHATQQSLHQIQLLDDNNSFPAYVRFHGLCPTCPPAFREAHCPAIESGGRTMMMSGQLHRGANDVCVGWKSNILDARGQRGMC